MYMIGFSVVAAAILFLMLRTGVATMGGIYIERARQPKLFALACSGVVLAVVAGIVGALVNLLK
jgi:glucose uptake protein GlcU